MSMAWRESSSEDVLQDLDKYSFSVVAEKNRFFTKWLNFNSRDCMVDPDRSFEYLNNNCKIIVFMLNFYYTIFYATSIFEIA